MFNPNSFITTKNLEKAVEFGLRFNVEYHKPAVSPRGWADNSMLVTNEQVENDIITIDKVVDFDTKDAQGNDVIVRSLVEAYAASNDLEINELVWIGVYSLEKDGKRFYSAKKHGVGKLIGFLCEDKEIAYKQYIKGACSKSEIAKKIQAKMNKELSLLNQWIRGGFIRITAIDMKGKEVASIENITNIMHVNDHIAWLIPDTEMSIA